MPLHSGKLRFCSMLRAVKAGLPESEEPFADGSVSESGTFSCKESDPLCFGRLKPNFQHRWMFKSSRQSQYGFNRGIYLRFLHQAVLGSLDRPLPLPIRHQEQSHRSAVTLRLPPCCSTSPGPWYPTSPRASGRSLLWGSPGLWPSTQGCPCPF